MIEDIHDYSALSSINPNLLQLTGRTPNEATELGYPQTPQEDTLDEEAPPERMGLDCLADIPPDQKPPYSYQVLVRFAILGSPKQRLTLGEIYTALEERYPWFKSAGPGWKNSIRHCLSLEGLFVRVPRPITEPGKGSYWTCDLEQHGYKRARKRNKKPKNTVKSAREASSVEMRLEQDDVPPTHHSGPETLWSETSRHDTPYRTIPPRYATDQAAPSPSATPMSMMGADRGALNYILSPKIVTGALSASSSSGNSSGTTSVRSDPAPSRSSSVISDVSEICATPSPHNHDIYLNLGSPSPSSRIDIALAELRRLRAENEALRIKVQSLGVENRVVQKRADNLAGELTNLKDIVMSIAVQTTDR